MCVVLVCVSFLAFRAARGAGLLLGSEHQCHFECAQFTSSHSNHESREQEPAGYTAESLKGRDLEIFDLSAVRVGRELQLVG
jgi:hypothetical protein